RDHRYPVLRHRAHDLIAHPRFRRRLWRRRRRTEASLEVSLEERSRLSRGFPTVLRLARWELNRPLDRPDAVGHLVADEHRLLERRALRDFLRGGRHDQTERRGLV